MNGPASAHKAFRRLLAAAAAAVLAALPPAAIPAAAAPVWTTAGAGVLSVPRRQETATLLPDGRILVAGGDNGGAPLASAELYNPATGVWTPTGGMFFARSGHTAVLLPTGKVLVAGGWNGGALGTSELYDPATGLWTVTGGMRASRMNHAATLLPDGRVLLSGGWNGGSLNSAEVYDPTAGTWAWTGFLSSARANHAAVLLRDGRVLAAGGDSGGALAAAELYDPGTGVWTPTGPMGWARTQHTATLLPDGRVLAAGGDNGGALSSSELYDPAAGTWAGTGGLNAARRSHAAALLPDGRVLAAGGDNGGALSSSELYDPVSGAWIPASPLAAPRASFPAVLLPAGKVLAVGGDNGGALTSVEAFAPSAGSWAPAGAFGTARELHSATLLPDGKVLAAGGWNGGSFASSELFDPAAGTWAPTGALFGARQAHTATLLPDGKVLVAGGWNGGALASAELYDPAAHTWTPTGSLSAARYYHSATLLPDGRVLVAGGINGVPLATAELYDPMAHTWTVVNSLNLARMNHTATLLPNGRVLVAGGWNTSALNLAEVYDPVAGTWTNTGTLGTARQAHTATLLPSGKVLAAGGLGAAALATAELYDPATGSWSATGNLAGARTYHTATLLPDGRVLAAGGASAFALLTAELYDPASGAWTAASSLSAPRQYHTATLLPDGRVLAAGGDDSGALASAELISYSEFDFDISTKAFFRPRIDAIGGSSSFPADLQPGLSYAVAGTTFTGLGEGSGGGTMSSPAGMPRLYLLRRDSGGYGAMAGGGWRSDLSSTVYGAAELAEYQSRSSSRSLSFTVPPALQCGYYQLFAMAGAVPSTFTAVRAAPAAPAAAPTGFTPPFPRVWASSVTFRWTPAGAGVTGYVVQASTSAAFEVAASTAFTTLPGLSSAPAAGLAPNTTYFFRVAAENCGGLGPYPGALASTATLALTPAAAASTFTAVYLTSTTVAWLPGGNPVDVTTYTVVLTSGTSWPNAFTGNVGLSTTPAGAAPAATLTGLLPNTTYSLFVDARNWNDATSGYKALGSTSTWAAPPASAASTFSAVTSSTMAVSWLANGNPLSVTNYTVVLTTGAVWPNAYTGNVSRSSAPAGALPTATLTGLAADTTYFAFAQARNWNGLGSPYAALGSTATLAFLPAAAASTFTAVFADSMTVSWSPGGNPVDVTTYTVVLTTGSAWPNAFTGNTALSTVPAGALPTATVAGLKADTTYYLFVDARNWYDAGSGYRALGSTSTLAYPPAAAASTFTAVYPSSMTVSWSPGGNPVSITTYTVVLTTGSAWPNAYTGNVALSTRPAGPAPTATLAGLLPNTTYSLFVDARNWNGASSGYAALGSTSTLAAPPGSAAAAFPSVRATSMTVSWLPGGNPVDVTTYTVVLSTGASWPNAYTGSVLLSTAPAGALPTATLSGLQADTTYNLFVQAVNWDGLGGGFSALGATSTLAFPPDSAVSTFGLVNFTSMTVSWSPGGNPVDVTTYTVVLTTGSAWPNAYPGNVALSTVPAGAQPTATLTGVLADTLYYLFADARNWNGASSGYAALGSTRTAAFPAPPAALGCATVRNVKKDGSGESLTIQGALALLPQSLAGNACVVVRDAQTYAEQVSVRGFANNGFRVLILADPALPARPAVVPPAGSTAAFVVANDSVSLVGLAAAPASPVPYGVLVSSAYAAISSVSVSGAGVSAAGVALSSSSSITGSSVAVAAAHGLRMTGAWSSVSASTFACAGAGFSAVWLNGASSGSVSGVFASGQDCGGLRLDAGASGNAVWGSTAVTSRWQSALALVDTSSNSVGESFFASSQDYGALLLRSRGDSVFQSTMASSGAGLSGLLVRQSSAAAVSACAVIGSTAAAVSGSTATAISGGFLAATAAGGFGLAVNGGSSGLSLSSAAVAAQALGYGVYLDSGSTGVLSLASVTVQGARWGLTVASQAASVSVASMTFSALAPGATALAFLGGSPVSTFAYVVFGDASVAVNADGAALGAGARITVCSASGPRAGPYYERDPGNHIDWPAVCGQPGTLGGSFTLAVAKTGPGRVTSFPSGLDCGGVCSVSFSAGTFVTLAAAPLAGSTFRGWGGACSGAGACLVVMGADAAVTAVFDPPSIPVQNYPNPFGHSGTKFTYRLSRPAGVVVRIYTLGGRRVRTIQEPGRLAGYNETAWDGRNEEGQEVARGVYLYQLVIDDGTGASVQTGKCAKRE